MSAKSSNIPLLRSSRKHLFISRKKAARDSVLRKESHCYKQYPEPKDDVEQDTYLQNRNTLKTQTETDSETGSDTIVSSHDGSTTDASFNSSYDEPSVLDLAFYDCNGGNIEVSNKWWSRNLPPNIIMEGDDHDEEESSQDHNSLKDSPSVSSSSHKAESIYLSVHSRTSSEASVSGRFDGSISSHTNVTTDSAKSPKGHHYSAYKDDSSCVSGHDRNSIVPQDDESIAMTTEGMPYCICIPVENDKIKFEEDTMSNYSEYCSTSAAAQETGGWACFTRENDDQTLDQTQTFDENNGNDDSEGEGNQLSIMSYDDQSISGNAPYGFCVRGGEDQVLHEVDSYHSRQKDHQRTVVEDGSDNDNDSRHSELKSCISSILSHEEKPIADAPCYGCFACRNDDDVLDDTQTFCSHYSEYNGYQSSVLSFNEKNTIVNAPCCACLPSRNTDQVLDNGKTNDKDVVNCDSEQTNKEKSDSKNGDNCRMRDEPTGFIRFSFRKADDVAKVDQQNDGQTTSGNTTVWGDQKGSTADEDMRLCQSFACCHNDDETLDGSVSSSLNRDVPSCLYGVRDNAPLKKDKMPSVTEVRQVSKDSPRKWDKSSIDAKLKHEQLQYSMKNFLKDIESDLDGKEDLKMKHRQLRNSRKTCLMDVEHDQDDTSDHDGGGRNNNKNIETTEHTKDNRPKDNNESDVANADASICCAFVCSKNDRVSDELAKPHAEFSKNRLFKNRKQLSKNEDLILAHRILHSDSSSTSTKPKDDNTPFDEREQWSRSKTGGKNFKTQSERNGYPFDEFKNKSSSSKQETHVSPPPLNLVKEETTKSPSSFFSMFDIFSSNVVNKGSDVTVDTNENLPESVKDHLDDYSAAMHDLVFGRSTDPWWWCCSGTNTTVDATNKPAQQTLKKDEIDQLLNTTVETSKKSVASATRETGKRKKRKKKKSQSLLF